MSDQEQQTKPDGGASVSTAMLERMAAALAEAANGCCSRSDGWEEGIMDQILATLKEAVLSERVACGEIANKKAAEVLAKNTYRGRTSSAASFAASMLEDVGAAIRMRSN